eukprot:CAMPEP_0172587786 /NCGR_PEP_ID=MMETSP1068-20121228/6791_1 /TAXON_ID=35684 /ORGANISM="Pseudopedinella elastica, Strain CCMP716" /LENGTH=539 /DNA_ID=CAMNT_0013382927 /DNA_START=231 /DNA_END=1850 /DNA_ORIENTATION=-
MASCSKQSAELLPSDIKGPSSKLSPGASFRGLVLADLVATNALHGWDLAPNGGGGGGDDLSHVVKATRGAHIRPADRLVRAHLDEEVAPVLRLLQARLFDGDGDPEDVEAPEDVEDEAHGEGRPGHDHQDEDQSRGQAGPVAAVEHARALVRPPLGAAVHLKVVLRRGEERGEEHPKGTAEAVDRGGVDHVVDARPLDVPRPDHVHHSAADGAHKGADGPGGGAARGDADEPGEHAVVAPEERGLIIAAGGRVELARLPARLLGLLALHRFVELVRVLHLKVVPQEARHQAPRRPGERGVARGPPGDLTRPDQAPMREGVEPEPAKPEDQSPKSLENRPIHGRLQASVGEGLPGADHARADEGGGAPEEVDDPAAGEVHHPAPQQSLVVPLGRQPPVGVPRPARHQGVDHADAEDRVGHVRERGAPLGNGPGEDGGGRGREGPTEDPLGVHVPGGTSHAPLLKVPLVEPELGGAGEPGGRVAVGEAEAGGPPAQSPDRRVHDVLEQHGRGGQLKIEHIHRPDLEHRESRLHEEHKGRSA